MNVKKLPDRVFSGTKGSRSPPAFDTMLKDAAWRRFDFLMVWSIDRLGRSVLQWRMR